jgi:hypothetical protein
MIIIIRITMMIQHRHMESLDRLLDDDDDDDDRREAAQSSLAIHM